MKIAVCLFAFITILTLSVIDTEAQVTTQTLGWNRLELTAKLPRKFKIGVDVNERYYIGPSAQHQLVLRTNLFYDLKHQWTTFAGYTYFLQSPNDPEATNKLNVPEHRIQQGFINVQDYGRLALNHRFQMEERFFRNVANGDLADGYRLVIRWRYRLMVDIKLLDKNDKQAKGDLVLRIGDEIHLNAGKSVKGQPFDQNRVMGFVQYFITNNLSVDVGYINWYQQRSGNQGFYNRHIFTTGIQAKLDFSKKRTTQSQI